MNEKKSKIAVKSGYLEFSYPAEGDPASTEAFELGLRIVAALKLKMALKAASVELKNAELEKFSTELSEIVALNLNAYSQVCTNVDTATSSLAQFMEQSGSLKTEAAQSAFKGLLKTKISGPWRY